MAACSAKVMFTTPFPASMRDTRGCFRCELDGHDLEEVLERLRQRTIAVPEVRCDAAEFFVACSARNLLVRSEPQAHILNVVFRDEGGRAQIDLGVGLRGDLLAPDFRHGLFHHLSIEVDAHGGDVAGLLFAQEIAGAARLRSWAAMRKPAPSSESSWIARSRLRAASESDSSAGVSR